MTYHPIGSEVWAPYQGRWIHCRIADHYPATGYELVPKSPGYPATIKASPGDVFLVVPDPGPQFNPNEWVEF